MQRTNVLQLETNKEAMTVASAYQLASVDQDLWKLSLYMSQAIFLEVATHPKPGLVTRSSNGSHKDMNIMTFLMSSAVLAQAFRDLQDIGMLHRGTTEQLLTRVREYGVSAEKELLLATKGVNTQRGILFSGGILCAAAGYCLGKELSKKELLPTVKAMTKGLVERELAKGTKLGKELTAGEKLYRKYGITGIRGEIERGLPSVTGYGLPALTEAFTRGASLNDALIYALLHLMTVTEDSNVVWRTNLETAGEVKMLAKEILACGSIFTEKGQRLMKQVGKYFKQQRISPGGSADLLSITVGLYLLENREFPCAIL